MNILRVQRNATQRNATQRNATQRNANKLCLSIQPCKFILGGF